jgi:hypothetical protein
MNIKSITKPVLLAGLLITGGSNAQAASISLNPLTSNVQVGSSFSVELLMDFSDEATLGGGLDVLYDSSFAMFNSFSFDSSFLPLTDPAFTCPGAGACPPINTLNSVANIAFGNFSGIGGIFTVGTLDFTAVAAGNIVLSTAETTGAAGPFVSALTYEQMAVTFNGTSITAVSAVPVPAAAWLFISGMGMFAGFARKRVTQ